MNKTEIFNSIAKWGLILGVAMSLSKIIEIKMLLQGSVGMTLMILVEMVVSILLFLYIIYRSNIERKMSLEKPEEYRFRAISNWSILISLFAGIIVGLATHIYINTSLGGYSGYLQSTHDAMVAIIDSANMDGASREEAIKALDGYTNVEGIEGISIFDSVLSAVMNYVIGGFVAAIVVTRFVKNYAKGE
ncbi:MAG: DUF4199 family protein [Rikenellaceae bacterium]